MDNAGLASLRSRSSACVLETSDRNLCTSSDCLPSRNSRPASCFLSPSDLAVSVSRHRLNSLISCIICSTCRADASASPSRATSRSLFRFSVDLCVFKALSSSVDRTGSSESSSLMGRIFPLTARRLLPAESSPCCGFPGCVRMKSLTLLCITLPIAAALPDAWLECDDKISLLSDLSWSTSLFLRLSRCTNSSWS